MHRYDLYALGVLFGVAAVCLTSASAVAQQDAATVPAAPPSRCFAHPQGLSAGAYAWDSPACAAARANWDHSRGTGEVTAEAGPPTQPSMTLPGGTPIDVHLNSGLSSSSAQVGDTFAFTVANDVRVKGWLFVVAGARGVGEITNVESAAGNGHAGKVSLQFDYVYAVDGEKIRVTPIDATTEGQQKQGAASTATIATYALIGPLGLLAHNWVKGREALLTPATPFAVFVADSVLVRAVGTAASR